jgi:hypothetical protein
MSPPDDGLAQVVGALDAQAQVAGIGSGRGIERKGHDHFAAQGPDDAVGFILTDDLAGDRVEGEHIVVEVEFASQEGELIDHRYLIAELGIVAALLQHQGIESWWQLLPPIRLWLVGAVPRRRTVPMPAVKLPSLRKEPSCTLIEEWPLTLSWALEPTRIP